VKTWLLNSFLFEKWLIENRELDKEEKVKLEKDVRKEKEEATRKAVRYMRRLR